jgi:glutamate dehydrogenase
MIGEKNDPEPSELPIGPLVDAFAEALGVSIQALPPAALGFITQAQDDWSAEELPGLDVADVARALADFWRFGEQSTDISEPVIRLRRAEGGEAPSDLLEIVQLDRPFLVDSIMGEVTEAGFSVRAMFHPVSDCGGVRRSMIQIRRGPRSGAGDQRSRGAFRRRPGR